MKSRQKNKQPGSLEFGFSLVELTVILAIVGVIGGGLLLNYGEQHDHAKWKESQIKLDVVKKSIIQFAAVNKFIPCPDTNDDGFENRTSTTGTAPALSEIAFTAAIDETATDPQIPAISSQTAQVAVPNVDVNRCTSTVGTVPYETLGLALDHVRDSWGNKLTYAVDLSADDADSLLTCPQNSACFFNSDDLLNDDGSMPLAGRNHPALPAYNFSTAPLDGSTPTTNLRICTDPSCANIQADGLLVVLVAHGHNASQTTNLSATEADNRDADRDYIRSDYSSVAGSHYDDLLASVAANEIRIDFEKEVIQIANNETGPIQVVANDVIGGGQTKIGQSGSNNSNDNSSNFMDSTVQTFDFGADKAGETIELKLNTRAVGTWDFKGDGNNSNDTAYIDVNGSNVSKMMYGTDAQKDGYFEHGGVDGYLKSFTDAGTGATYQLKDSDVVGDVDDYAEDYVLMDDINGSPDQHLKYWDDSHEYLVTLDENGQLELDLKVGTTGTDETVDFTDIVMTYYDLPETKPSFPYVDPTGLPDTGGLD